MGASSNNKELNKIIIHIIWLDKEVNNEENKKYQQFFTKNEQQIDFLSCTETKNCIYNLNKINDFKKTFVIISGSLLIDFCKKFEKSEKDKLQKKDSKNEEINEITVVPDILIFTSSKRFISIKEFILTNNFPLLDCNSIFFEFEPIKQKIEESLSYKFDKKETEKLNTQNEDIFCFEHIKDQKDLILPLHFQDFIEYPNKNEITKFNQFLLDQFSDEELYKLIQQLFLKAVIPCQILVKYYLRAYTLQSAFYSQMNKSLQKYLVEDYQLVKNYETYIKVVYHGLLSKYIPFKIDCKLFRGTRIKKKELDFIKNALKLKKDNLPACTCFSKGFLSSSILEKVAFTFMIKEKKENEVRILFIIEKGEKYDEQNISNSDITNYSFYKGEKEILFFPFSYFEINKVSKELPYEFKDEEEKIYKGNYYKIYLNYLGKYADKIDKNEKIPENKFAQIFFQTNLTDKFELEKKPEQFDFNIRNYITPELKTNYIYATYKIKNEDLNKKIKILNHNDSNKEKIEKLCTIYLKGERIKFDFEYIFDKEGTYTFIFQFSDLITNASKLFYGCNLLISPDFQSFRTNLITDMSDMFNGCCSIKSLDLSSFKTDEVTNMKQMFCDCEYLENLDLSSFNVIKVTDMSYMFKNCRSLSFLNLSKFKTENVKTMLGMFNNCESLINVNLSNFKTEQVNNMSEMFSSCSSLKSLNLSKFITNNVTQMNKMFYQCSSLTSLNINNFNTEKVTTMENMFAECKDLTSLDLSNFVTKEVNNMSEMFSFCLSLKSLNLSKFDTINVTKMNKMFYKCSSLTSLNINNFNTQKVTTMENMFNECKDLTSLDLSNFVTKEVNNMSEMFSSCSSLKSLDLSKFVTNNVTQMNKMFYQCSSLTSLNINNFNTEKVTTMENMFTKCSSITSLDLSNFQTNEVKNMKEMFKKCSFLKNLNLINFDTTKVENMENMFLNCDSLNFVEISQNFQLLNTIEGLKDECKIKYENHELVVKEIKEFYKDLDKNNINSSVVSVDSDNINNYNFTYYHLLKNSVIRNNESNY